MDFITLGDHDRPAVMLIHGMATTAELCYGDLARRLSKAYYVVLPKLDGYNERDDTIFESVEKECEQIEQYIVDHLKGHLFGVIGLSLGGTIATHLLARHKINAQKALLDAAFCVNMGVLTPVFTHIFTNEIIKLQSGKRVSPICIQLMGGKTNNSILEMLYKGVSPQTIRNTCNSVYRYKPLKGLSTSKAQVLFIHGSKEPFPAKAAKNLKQLMPQLSVKVMDQMGHGQFLSQCPNQYEKLVVAFLEKGGENL